MFVVSHCFDKIDDGRIDGFEIEGELLFRKIGVIFEELFRQIVSEDVSNIVDWMQFDSKQL